MSKLAELAVESKQLLAHMDNLRNQFEDAKASGQPPNTAILDQMAVTSRRFRELAGKMHDGGTKHGAVA